MVFTEEQDPPLTVEELKSVHLLEESESDYMGMHVDAADVGVDTVQSTLSIFDELHQNPSFLPKEYVVDSVKKILAITLVITFVNLVIFFVLKRREGKQQSKESYAKRASYQMTHFLVNLVLAIQGLYLYNSVQKFPQEYKYKVTGWEIEFALLPQIQLAYNLWALPAGIFYVQERYEMIAHHLAVVCISSISGFRTNGFRYYAPFFFGVIETSSVPLSIMNIFKSSKELSKKYPITSTFVSITFAIIFLIVRIYLWMPLMYDFLEVVFLMGFNHSNGSGQGAIDKAVAVAPYILAFATGLFLSLLQIIWGYKVVRGILRLIGISKKVPKNKKDA
mmetsp:Transcript_17968/g.25594  ORF Transcript_17968/g.25594 Transcript_17968/m.25594 type:complete len:335 (-) Transcript_17968:276-1280(-)|eukprot:CAMPEP_0172419462 /NCGR_PEP_ID=MMETSP1064-20121228/5898_1 /TAXON_ID=202472 /ORGANISM="Aulacoseira subarctica , Strain CCAP 1002/5" /LENGTH=334 /DNA_ID=CAMNT_0013158963 /DNA_START=89 /DNA_END=1093 /DNA_ORIENTATION=-